MITMTAPQAFFFLSQQWRKHEQYDIKGKLFPCILLTENRDDPAFGLCRSIERLCLTHRIDVDVRNAMRKRLEAYLHEHSWTGAYQWPLTEAGAKERAEACLVLSKESY